MSDWTCEIMVKLDGEELLVVAHVAQTEFTVENFQVVVDHVVGCTREGDEVEIDCIPLHWWPPIKEAVLDEIQAQSESE